MNSRIILFFACIALLFQSCQEKSSTSVQIVGVLDFEEKLNNSADKIILDVRTLPEYQKAHLENSVLIDIQKEGFTAIINKLDKLKPVFVYCASGARSKKAASILKAEGFKEIYHLDGGINEWINSKKPVVQD